MHLCKIEPKKKNMKLKTFVKTLLVAGALTTAFACDKDKDKKELPSLDGYVKLSAPKYILQGEQLEVTPEGVQHPKGGALGYFIIGVLCAWRFGDNQKIALGS